MMCVNKSGREHDPPTDALRTCGMGQAMFRGCYAISARPVRRL